jgi:predicted TIM-barrel enzyme
MANYKDSFPNRHSLITVIHSSSQEQILQNLRIARDNGADGAFLISHGRMTDTELIEVRQWAKDKIPDFWIGLNCLRMDPEEVFRNIYATTDGLWLDDIGVRPEGKNMARTAAIDESRQQSGWRGLLFGSIAFKYQVQISAKDLPSVALAAKKYCDVITTSGPATGKPPSVGKIKAIREAVGNFPIAIASGMTPANVGDYLPYADCFLVATGISTDFTNLHPWKLKQFVKAMRAQ